jgi:hypothetical protein
VADGGLALHANELLEVVDVEGRLRRVVHAPHHHRADLDRVAALVVHLQRVDRMVARAHAHALAHVPGPRPAKAGLPLGAEIVAEEREDTRFVRLEREETRADEDDREGVADDEHGVATTAMKPISRTMRTSTSSSIAMPLAVRYVVSVLLPSLRYGLMLFDTDSSLPARPGAIKVISL